MFDRTTNCFILEPFRDIRQELKFSIYCISVTSIVYSRVCYLNIFVFFNNYDIYISASHLIKSGILLNISSK